MARKRLTDTQLKLKFTSTNDPGASGAVAQHDLYHYLEGKTVGTVSSKASRTSAGVDIYADFDQSYAPMLAEAPRQYAVEEGDTLQSVAEKLWGDASLWYVLAEKNGLAPDAQLATGQLLIVPDGVMSAHNTDDTFRPYDPNKAIGDVSPSAPEAPPPPKKHGGCGIIGNIIVIAIAVAITALIRVPVTNAIITALGGSTLTGAAVTAATVVGTIAGGAVTGAIASVVSQGVGVAIGAQDKISWKGVAMSAIAGGISAGTGQIQGLSQSSIAGSVPRTAGGAVRERRGEARRALPRARGRDGGADRGRRL